MKGLFTFFLVFFYLCPLGLYHRHTKIYIFDFPNCYAFFFCFFFVFPFTLKCCCQGQPHILHDSLPPRRTMGKAITPIASKSPADLQYRGCLRFLTRVFSLQKQTAVWVANSSSVTTSAFIRQNRSEHFSFAATSACLKAAIIGPARQFYLQNGKYLNISASERHTSLGSDTQPENGHWNHKNIL